MKDPNRSLDKRYAWIALRYGILYGAPLPDAKRGEDSRNLDVSFIAQMADEDQFFCNAPDGNTRWRPLSETVFGAVRQNAHHLAFELSCLNICAMRRGCTFTVRFAVDQDVDSIKKIAGQHSKQLGYVNPAALKDTSIPRRNLVVAVQREQTDGSSNEQILGFVNYRACRDGWQTVYHLGVDRAFKGQHIGAGLLSAVPSPVRLHCLVENTPANAFYKAQGFIHAGIDKGNKRPNNIWHRLV